VRKVRYLSMTPSLMPHMTKSIVLENNEQNESQIPAILIVQIFKKKLQI